MRTCNRVQLLQLDPCAGSREAPLNRRFAHVSFLDPGAHLAAQRLLVWNTTVKTLPAAYGGCASSLVFRTVLQRTLLVVVPGQGPGAFFP
jgi:hypothetical protein